MRALISGIVRFHCDLIESRVITPGEAGREEVINRRLHRGETYLRTRLDVRPNFKGERDNATRDTCPLVA